MDLESYIARYSGETRLQRLLLVARTTSNESIAAQAFDLAEEQMKSDGNVKRYMKVFSPSEQSSSAEQSTGSTPQEAAFRRPTKPYDEEWVLATQLANGNARHVLQGRLTTAKSHMSKEAIRNAYIALAQHDMKTGDVPDALASLMRATSYCTTHFQTTDLSLLILELLLSMQQFKQAREYINSVEHTLNAMGGATSSTAASAPSPASAGSGAGGHNGIRIKLKIASGLERLAERDYAKAATIFSDLTMTTSSSNMEWPGVTCAEDIALYASLLAVASQDRTSILGLAEHPEALELAPAMKELLSQWCRANYKTCMQKFTDMDAADEESLVPLGDLYLRGSGCWKDLSKTIREKCVVEFVQPYHCVRLENMAQVFPTISNLEDTLVDLMRRGLIMNAKIDARANILLKSQPKPKIDLASMERRVLDDTHAMMIRLACLENDLSVQDTSVRQRRAAAAAPRNDDDSDYSERGEDTPMLDADARNPEENPEDIY